MSKPNWLEDCMNEAGVINPHKYNAARSKRAVMIANAREEVMRLRLEVRHEPDPYKQGRAANELQKAVQALIDLDFN